MKKKIGILTQPLHDNYGGILQAYALKETLLSFGHDVVVINRQGRKHSAIREIASIIKNKLKGKKTKPRLSEKQSEVISQHTLAFIKKHIPNLSHLITNNRDMRKLNNLGFDVYVVGSDQSWRPKYSPKISNYFLDFAKDEKGIKRISYAVSFGVSHWEFNNDDRQECSSLAKSFDAISVREDSGIPLVKEYFGMDAMHVLDPTMLLSKEHYLRVVKEEKPPKSNGELKIYILDKTPETNLIVNTFEIALGMKSFEVLPKSRLGIDKIKDINDFVFPNPAEWLRGYQDAKFVITDSFHGTVFSILFNIPFVSIGNKNRGVARFESLLRIFGLEDRLITESTEINIDDFAKEKIDWNKINATLQQEKDKSMKFLNDYLA